jgi:hypothetical protein
MVTHSDAEWKVSRQEAVGRKIAGWTKMSPGYFFVIFHFPFAIDHFSLIRLRLMAYEWNEVWWIGMKGDGISSLPARSQPLK